jgi:hypothetical protein
LQVAHRFAPPIFFGSAPAKSIFSSNGRSAASDSGIFLSFNCLGLGE